MQIVAKQETTTARSKISDAIVINYTAERQTGSPLDRINGRILKNDVVAGYFNASRQGESGLTFISGHSLTTEEKKEISSQIYADEEELFSVGNTPE
jgi:hypothetical protein